MRISSWFTQLLLVYSTALVRHFSPAFSGPPDSAPPTADRYRKGKGKGLDNCYSATYMSQTRDQQRFIISEVAADWHEPMVPQRIM